MGTQPPSAVVTKVDDGFNVKLTSGATADLASIEIEINRVIAAKPRRVYLDMSACDFISSAGMGALVHFYSRVKAQGGSIKIVAIRKIVFNSFKIGRLDQFFGISPDAIIGK